MRNISKYVELMNWLETQILDGTLESGDKIPSENELGEKFSISRQTVRQATSVLESRGLLERRRGSGTYVKYSCTEQAMPISSAKTIGVVTTYLNDYIFPDIIKGIDDALEKKKYFVQMSLTYNNMEKEANIINNLLSKNIEGLIIEPAKTGLPNMNGAIYDRIKQLEIPCVFLNTGYPDLGIPCVSMDDYACGKEAIEYLVKNGHKNIGGLFKLDDMQGRLRYAGCIDALRKEKMSFADNDLIWYTTEDNNESFLRHFQDRVLKISKNCTAMVCYNDEMARQIIKILYDAGKKIPTDFSLISFDDASLDFQMEFGFGLTTFAHPKQKLGQMAAQMLLKLMNNETVTDVKFPPDLIKRSSINKIK
ncbi:GntR family transcriptional regulator [Pectinatus brassicae]|uniref:GntR family transcriptional regulator of arabinose operon n=1 Tax=Pectinatus brassicae TaxID=862415 RepID=A0A840UDH9_9FIRM|nr:GntR family transcriptional regulator [Pectinatus brassicae]MBB5335156.1 GntR family transcriptional regulator of arabinose operon [Pectinatus brassicae]